MSEILKRLRTARAAVRGWPIVSDVSISDGIVDIHRRNLHISGSEIRSCHIWTQGPVILRADRTSQVTGNEGDAIVAVQKV